MRFRVVAVFVAASLAAVAQQKLTVDQLVSFVKSSVQQLKLSDKDVANFLEKAQMTERLDARTIEDLQGMGAGPRTLEALNHLREQSAGLSAPPTVAPVAPPRPIPPPSSEDQAAVISDVRDYALNYSKGLPNYICSQVTRRYQAPAGRRDSDGEPSWQKIDELLLRLSYFDEKEDYKLVMVNNRVTSQDYNDIGGATSRGEFGSLLLEIFEPATGTRFGWERWATLRGRRVMVFNYHVLQSASQWHIDYQHQMDIVPAYHGLVEVDRDTHEVMRVTLEAEGIPADFPVRVVQTTLDYDFQEISGHTFLLPLRAVTIMSADGILTKNEVEFRLYRKYAAESEIKFDTPPPLTDDQTKEVPDAK